MDARTNPLKHDPIASSLTQADDRIRLSKWLPPQAGVMPKIRIGRRWFSMLWALPIIFVLLVIGVALAQGLREHAWRAGVYRALPRRSGLSARG
jgi:methionine sulfoxide reductase catalytic subunit